MTSEKRLIDANEILQRNDDAFKNAKANPHEHLVAVLQYHTVKEMVNSSPTVDAVEVVRCKDCKHWSDGVAGCTDHVKCCKIGFYMVGENGYCVYGEKKP